MLMVLLKRDLQILLNVVVLVQVKIPISMMFQDLLEGAAYSAPRRRLKVVLDYFVHEASGDYFNAQSYVGIEYKDIPTWKPDGGIMFLRDTLDFRPGVLEQVC